MSNENTGLREKLASELIPTDWKTLAVHYRRDGLFVVGAELPLLEAAVAIADDDQSAVAAWIEEGLLARPTPEKVETWQAEEGPHFLASIVQPFVLVQRLEHVAPSEAN